MHERSLMTGLLARLDEIAGASGSSRVVRVRVAVGALAHLSPEHLRHHFEHAARGTRAEGAEIEIRVLEDVGEARAQEIIIESADIEDP